MGKRKDALNEIKKKVVPILKRNNIKRAGIFGSYARGEQTKDSDVDILIEVRDNRMSLFGFVRVKIELEEKLGRGVDLVEYSVVKDRIKRSVLDSEVRII